MLKFLSVFLLFFLVSCGHQNFSRKKYTDLNKLKLEKRKSEVQGHSFGPETFVVDNSNSKQDSQDDCGDRLTFKTGSFIDVKVIRISENEIIYRPCNNLEGPDITVLKSSIAELRYQNGEIENLTKKEEKLDETINKPNQTENCGDVLALKNGEQIVCKVIEVNIGDIVYRKCDDLSGPAYTVAKPEIASLTYQNGEKEMLESLKQPDPIKQKVGKELEEYALGSMVVVLVLPILFIVSLILALISLKRQNEEPERYNLASKILAIMALCFSLLILFFIVLLIAILLI